MDSLYVFKCNCVSVTYLIYFQGDDSDEKVLRAINPGRYERPRCLGGINYFYLQGGKVQR
jgi:hypothetical protein